MPLRRYVFSVQFGSSALNAHAYLEKHLFPVGFASASAPCMQRFPGPPNRHENDPQEAKSSNQDKLHGINGPPSTTQALTGTMGACTYRLVLCLAVEIIMSMGLGFQMRPFYSPRTTTCRHCIEVFWPFRISVACREETPPVQNLQLPFDNQMVAMQHTPDACQRYIPWDPRFPIR